MRSLYILLVCGIVFASASLYAKEEEPITVRAGDEFEIVLKANHTTGYQWRQSQDLDATMLELVGNNYEAPTVKRMGAGGQEIWSFKALKNGRTYIFMKYIRPWEENKPADQKTFTIVIE